MKPLLPRSCAVEDVELEDAEDSVAEALDDDFSSNFGRFEMSPPGLKNDPISRFMLYWREKTPNTNSVNKKK